MGKCPHHIIYINGIFNLLCSPLLQADGRSSVTASSPSVGTPQRMPLKGCPLPTPPPSVSHRARMPFAAIPSLSPRPRLSHLSPPRPELCSFRLQTRTTPGREQPCGSSTATTRGQCTSGPGRGGWSELPQLSLPPSISTCPIPQPIGG